MDARYRLAQPDGNTEDVRDSVHFKLFTRRQLANTLEREGFTVCNQYGDYDKCPVSRGTELVFVCLKTEDALDLYGRWNPKRFYTCWNVDWFVAAVFRKLRRVVRRTAAHLVD